MNLKAILFTAIVVIAATLVSYEASATTKLAPCNGCTYDGMKRTAELSQKRVGSSNIAVVNFRNATAHKFRTSLEIDGDGEPVINTTPVSFSTNEQRDIDLYFRFRDALGAYIANFSNKLYDSSLDSKTHIISPTHPQYSLNTFDNKSSYVSKGVILVKGSPYEFLSASYQRNDVYDWFIGGAKKDVLAILDSSLQAVELPNGKDLDLDLDAIFYTSPEALKNGNQNGRIKITLDFINEAFVIINARDTNNNSIPLKNDKLMGE